MTARIFQLIAFLCLMAACVTTGQSGDSWLHTVGPRTENLKSNCNTVSTYGYNHVQTGEFRRYSAVIHSQVPLTDKHFTARDIAELSSIVVNKTPGIIPGVDKWRYTALELMFQKTHVIVVANSKALNALWDQSLDSIVNPTPGKHVVARTARSITSCWDAPNNTWHYTIVQANFKKNDVDTVSHEAMHLVGLIMLGDSDSDHVNPVLFDEHGPGSLQEAVEFGWIHQRIEVHRNPWMR